MGKYYGKWFYSEQFKRFEHCDSPLDSATVRLVTDRATINKVILDPDIYERTTDDFCPCVERLNFPYNKYLFLGGFVKGEIAALYYQNAFRDGQMAHFQVLKPYRQKYARYFAKAFLDFIKPSSGNIYGEIPLLYKDYIHFVRKLGFKDVEIIRQNYIKNGNTYDSQLLVY